jgi:hypothetical protein
MYRECTTALNQLVIGNFALALQVKHFYLTQILSKDEGTDLPSISNPESAQ